MTYWVPQQEDWQQQLKYYGGMPRLAEVEELGGAYVYLLSDAASYTTSIDIPVNGVIGSECYPRLFTPFDLELTLSSLLEDLKQFVANIHSANGNSCVFIGVDTTKLLRLTRPQTAVMLTT